MGTQEDFIPGLSLRWLTPLYDFVMAKLFPEKAFKQELVRRVAIEPGYRVLDLGCGTGLLARARRRAQTAGAAIQFDRGFADHLPYSDGSFDCGVILEIIWQRILHAIWYSDHCSPGALPDTSPGRRPFRCWAL